MIVRVPVGGPLFLLDQAYTAKLTVAANTLPEENPGDPTQSGTYKIVEGPIIKVENPL